MNINHNSSEMMSVRLGSSSSSPLPVLLVVVAVVMVMTTARSLAFDTSAYCHDVCILGRGGNVCRCNTGRFAGKRAGALWPSLWPSSSSLFDDGSAATLTHTDDTGMVTRRRQRDSLLPTWYHPTPSRRLAMDWWSFPQAFRHRRHVHQDHHQ